MPPELIEALKILGMAGGAFEGMRRGVAFFVNGEISDLRSEMGRRFDKLDIRLTDVEEDVADVQETVDRLRSGRLDTAERLGRLEGEHD